MARDDRIRRLFDRFLRAWGDSDAAAYVACFTENSDLRLIRRHPVGRPRAHPSRPRSTLSWRSGRVQARRRDRIDQVPRAGHRAHLRECLGADALANRPAEGPAVAPDARGGALRGWPAVPRRTTAGCARCGFRESIRCRRDWPDFRGGSPVVSESDRLERACEPGCGTGWCGDEGNRTPNPRLAKAVLCQLSYVPVGHTWGYQDLNLGPLRYQRSALTA